MPGARIYTNALHKGSAMRILIISHDIEHVRDYYQAIISVLSEQHEIIIVAPQSDTVLAAMTGVTIVTWNWPVNAWQIKSRWQAQRRLARIIQLHHPELIWSIDLSVSDGLRRLLRKKRYWRWVVSLSSGGSARQWGRLSRCASQIMVHHTEVAAEQTQAQLIPAPSVNCPARPIALPKKPVILFYGRLSSHNGLDRFLDAAKELKPFYPDAQFWVAGSMDSMQREAVEVALSEAQAADEIHYIDQVDDLVVLLKKVSLVVIPAQLCDRVPASMIHSLALGRPVITMNVPGIRCVFEHGKQGWIVAFADRGGIALRISHALAYPEQLKAMSQASYQLAKQHYHQPITQQALLSTILGA